VQVIAVVALTFTLLLGLQLVPQDRTTVWLLIFGMCAAGSIAAIVLARMGRIEVAAIVLIAGLLAACLVSPAYTHDLATTPLWLGAVGACALTILPRGSAVKLGLLLLLVLGVMAVLAPSASFNEPTYIDLVVGGALVSMATTVVAVYGVRTRLKSQREALALSAVADDLLDEVQATRRLLEERVANRERDLTSVLAEQEKLITELADLAVRDPRTGLFNARHHENLWPTVVAESRSTNLPVSLIAFDLDAFGRINRNYSHTHGDRVLEEFTELVRRLIRPSDIPYRLGQGEEFLVLLPHTRLDEAGDVAERIRVATRRHEWDGLPDSERLTVSAGVAQREAEGDESWQLFLERADEALLQAKSNGRDQVRQAETRGGQP
jgi:diguanylate cyclase (GGDEF)-like protein